MQKLNHRTTGSATALARKGLLITAVLAGAGSGLGIIAIRHGGFSRIETGLVLSSGLFALLIAVTLLAFRNVPVQMVAGASTLNYMLYLLAGIAVGLGNGGNRDHLLVYMVWFFPLLVFNKLVNSPVAGRWFARILVAAPFIAIGCLGPRPLEALPIESRILIAAYCLSYACFALTLDVVSGYRETYVMERERSERMKVESNVLESISDCFISLDSEFRLIYVNDAACAEFSRGRCGALQGTVPYSIPDFFSDGMLAELRSASARSVASSFEAQNAAQDRWYEMRCFPKPDGMSVCFRNITEFVMSRNNLEAAHNVLREQSELLDNAQDAIFVEDMDHRFLYWNRGAERLFGWAAQEIIGRRSEDVFRHGRAEMLRALASVVAQGDWCGELTKRARDGRLLTVASRCTLVRRPDGSPRSILVINTDITGQKAAQAKIRHLAFYDPLTRLANRSLLRERLDRALAAAHLKHEMGAVIVIDLDDFKTLNDTSGHETGDLLLQQVARELKSLVRKRDSLARLGGDEFAFVLEGLGEDAEIAAREAQQVGERIIRAAQRPHRLKDSEYLGTASLGITLFGRGDDTPDDLLKRAELAMYRAKAKGRNTMSLFDPSMAKSVAARAALQADLRKALAAEQFELYYQPQVNREGRVVGAEALLRWPHPRRGMVPPSEFIPLAEEAGLIVELGCWVLRTTCRQLAAWAATSGLGELRIAFNVSNHQFLDSQFVGRVEEEIARSGADPGRLKLEITESSAMVRVNNTVAKMEALRALGVSFSLDDFGTGYSSLSQLKRLPLEQLKIDQSFVRDLPDGVQDASIVRTIINLGRNLNLSVIAEGVESERQRRFLESQGCHVYQGHLFSEALPAREFEAFVAARHLKQAGVA